jgi:hypothetical protein
MEPRSKEHRRDIWALRRYMLVAQIASMGIILFELVVIALFIDPTFLGGRRGKSESIWLWVGCGFILWLNLGIRELSKQGLE